MKSHSAAAVLIAPLVLCAVGLSPAHAQPNDMFPTRAAAMGWEWIPCKTFEDYQKAVRKESS